MTDELFTADPDDNWGRWRPVDIPAVITPEVRRDLEDRVRILEMSIRRATSVNSPEYKSAVREKALILKALL